MAASDIWLLLWALLISGGAFLLLIICLGAIGLEPTRSDAVRRKLTKSVGLPLLLCIPLLCCCFPFSCLQVDASLADNLRNGMTQAEVKAILGLPHERRLIDGGERWTYYLSQGGWQLPFASLMRPLHLQFDKQGIVRDVFSGWLGLLGKRAV
jgi:hypothetical protein